MYNLFSSTEGWELEVNNSLVICVMLYEGPGNINIKLQQPGPEVANSPKDHFAVCMTKTTFHRPIS